MKSASFFVICIAIISILPGGPAIAGEADASAQDVTEYRQYREARVNPTYANEFSVISQYLNLLRANSFLPDYQAQLKKSIRYVNPVLLKEELFMSAPNYALGYTFDESWGWNEKALTSLRKCKDYSFKNNNLGTLLSTIDRLFAYLKRAHQLSPKQAAAFNIDFRNEFNQVVIQEINKKLSLIKYMEDHDLYTSTANADLHEFIIAYTTRGKSPRRVGYEDLARVIRSEIKLQVPRSVSNACKGYLENR